MSQDIHSGVSQLRSRQVSAATYDCNRHLRLPKLLLHLRNVYSSTTGIDTARKLITGEIDNDHASDIVNLKIVPLKNAEADESHTKRIEKQYQTYVFDKLPDPSGKVPEQPNNKNYHYARKAVPTQDQLFLTLSKVGRLTVQDALLNKDIRKIIDKNSREKDRGKCPSDEPDENIRGDEAEIAELKQKEAESKANKTAAIKAQADKLLNDASWAMEPVHDAKSSVDKNSINELRDLINPDSIELVDVAAACAFLLHNEKEKIGFEEAKEKLFKNPGVFLDEIFSFDVNKIPDQALTNVQPILELPHFNYDNMKDKSIAAANLTLWAVNVVKYNSIYKQVAPLMPQLAKAAQESDAASAEAIKAKSAAERAAASKKNISSTDEKNSNSENATISDATTLLVKSCVIFANANRKKHGLIAKPEPYNTGHGQGAWKGECRKNTESTREDDERDFYFHEDFAKDYFSSEKQFDKVFQNLKNERKTVFRSYSEDPQQTKDLDTCANSMKTDQEYFKNLELVLENAFEIEEKAVTKNSNDSLFDENGALKKQKKADKAPEEKEKARLAIEAFKANIPHLDSDLQNLQRPLTMILHQPLSAIIKGSPETKKTPNYYGAKITNGVACPRAVTKDNKMLSKSGPK